MGVDLDKLLKFGLVGGATLGVAIPVLGTGLDLLKDRFKKIYGPSWDAMGQARMYGNHAGDLRYAGMQEQVLKGMTELPYNIVSNQAEKMGEELFSMPSNLYRKYKREQNFDQLVNDLNVQAMGVDEARDVYREVSRLAPEVIRRAPHAALPAIQNTLVTGSRSIDPMYVKNLVDAQFRLTGR